MALLFGSYYDWWCGLCDYCADEWVGVLQVLFVSFTKGPGGSPYTLIITEEVTTLEPTYGLTFANHRAFVLE